MAKDTRDTGRIRLKSEPAAELAGLRADAARGRKFRRGNLPLVIMAVALLALFLLSAGFLVYVNPEHRSLAYIRELSMQKFRHLIAFVFGGVAEGGIQFAVCRCVMVVLAGACLAASGAVYNGAFRNVLASPSVLGVQSGGGLGNIAYVLLFVSAETGAVRYSETAELAENYTVLDRNLQQAMVLLGCFLAVFIVVGTATAAGRGKLKTTHLILSGMIFSTVISGFTGLVQYYLLMLNPGDIRIAILQSLTMGSFDRAFTREHLLLMLAFLAPCVLILLLLSARLDALALGEEDAMALGLPVKLFRGLVIFVNTLMTAVVIAFCGQIGFVGFIVPQAARRLVGPGFRRLLPASMLMGALLLLVVYDIAYLTSMTGYLNLFTSALGSAAMVFALLFGKGVRRDAG